MRSMVGYWTVVQLECVHSNVRCGPIVDSCAAESYPHSRQHVVQGQEDDECGAGLARTRLPIAIIRLTRTCGHMSRYGSELGNSADACFAAPPSIITQWVREETGEKTSHYNCSFDAGTDSPEPCERESSGINRQAAVQKCVLRHGKVAEKSGVLERPIRMSRQRTSGRRSGGGSPAGQEYSR
jgi:hypothetical protein